MAETVNVIVAIEDHERLAKKGSLFGSGSRAPSKRQPPAVWRSKRRHGVVGEDGGYRLSGRHGSLRGVEEADELLLPMLCHTAPDHGSDENVQGKA